VACSGDLYEERALFGTAPAQRAVYGVGIRDPLSLFLAAAIVLALATIASRMPARRASRVEPSAALRDE
jgi:hypothetical protein